MDEPSMGLDPKSRHTVFETIRTLNEGGRTVLLVEQNARAGLAIADRGAVMDAGVVRLVATSDELLRDPRVAEPDLAQHPPSSAGADGPSRVVRLRGAGLAGARSHR